MRCFALSACLLAVLVLAVHRPAGTPVARDSALVTDTPNELDELGEHERAATAGDMAKAEEWARRAVANRPDSAPAQRTLARWLLDQGQTRAAAVPLARAVKLDPTSRDTQALVGLMARYERKLALAEEVYDELLRRDPADVIAAWNLALVLAESQDPQKRRRAVSLAEDEAKKQQNNPETFAVYAWALYHSGRLDDAERIIAAATQLGSVTRDAAYIAGRILADKNKPDLAVMALKAAMDGRGAFVYKAETEQLLAEQQLKVPAFKK